METKTMLADVLNKHVDDKKDGSKHRALRHALVDQGCGGAGVTERDIIFTFHVYDRTLILRGEGHDGFATGEKAAKPVITVCNCGTTGYS